MSQLKANMPPFQQSQYTLTGFLRDPDNQVPPAGIEARRLKIYQDLVYNNIESFVSSGFPILRTLYSDAAWQQLVRLFIVGHRCHSPYFLEISQEFLHFLQQNFATPPVDKPFLLELAHYEWVELALSVSTEATPAEPKSVDKLLQHGLSISPVAWRLCYQFPVQQIGESYQPVELPEQPTFLVVYRDFTDTVKFMEVNAVTSRLLQLIEESSDITGEEALVAIAAELAQSVAGVRDFGEQLLAQLYQASIIEIAKP